MSAVAVALGTGAASREAFASERTLAEPSFPTNPFTLGVASGDPLPDGVVLWTRLAPDPLASGGSGGVPEESYEVRWEIAKDEAFRKIVRRGTVVATPELGHSVHPEVSDLRPATHYYYRFRIGSAVSPVGRTKTAPARGANLSQLSFALASCQAYTGGRYAAYRTMAQEDLDFVLHVGDYIYEGAATRTLSDFRLLYATYKLSPDLQAAHAAFPFVLTLDDHEVDNNWAADIPQDDTPNFRELMANAFQAYYENLPLRIGSRPDGAEIPLYRKLTFGKLAEFNVMDTRQYRTDQANGDFIAPMDPDAADPAATMTGAEQDRWLYHNLKVSKARWNVLAQQTIMAPFDYDPGAGVHINHDAWDGYVAARERLLSHVRAQRVSNPVVLSGDWHSHWVNDLKQDYADAAAPIVATEFVATSISSGCGWTAAVQAALAANPHVKFFNGDYRGYVHCRVTPETWRSDMKVVNDPAATAGSSASLAAFEVRNGRPGAVRIPGLEVGAIKAPTMFTAEPSQAYVALRNTTAHDVEVTVRLTPPQGWQTQTVTRVLAPAEAASVEVPLTPPGGVVPLAGKVVVELQSPADVTLFGLIDDLWVVAVPRGEQALLALDWGPSTSPLLETFERLTPGHGWDPEIGYGWVGRPPQAQDRETFAVLQREYLLDRGTANILRLAVPAGRHTVYVLAGAPDHESGNTIIHENGALLAQTGNQIMPKGELRWLAFDLDGGAAGRTADLAITGALRFGYWTIEALMMQPAG